MLNNKITLKIFSGALWTFLQTIGMKFISFFGQIILAWILAPEIFGKIALVYTITNISSLMQQFGLQDVLIKRNRSFEIWYPLSIGLTFIISVLSVLVAITAGYLGSLFYNDTLVFYLVLIFTISMPFQALSLLPDTKLKIDLKFKEISIFKLIEIFLIQFGIIVFALLDFGVFSFIIPVVITSILRCIFLFYYTGLNIVYPNFKRWQYLTYNSVQGLFFAISSRLSMQVDIILLGLISTQAIIGVYYMGMTLSVQVIGFIGATLPSILFPALMSYSGKDLSKVLFPLQKIVIYIALIGVPFALWQATNAKPLISLFLSEKWLDSIIYVQIFSVGMVFRLVSSSWVVPLKLQGNFKGMSNITFISLILLVIIITIFGYFFNTIGIAVGVSFFYFIISPYLIFKGFENFKINYAYMFSNILKIILMAFMSYGIIFLITESVSYLSDNLILNLFFNSVISTILYFGLVYIFMKNYLLELIKKALTIKN